MTCAARALIALLAACLAACGGPERRPQDEERWLKTTPSRPRPALAEVPPPEGEPGRLEVHIINVGQGDAALVRCPDGEHQLLIDSGELEGRYQGSQERFQAYLREHQAAGDPLEVVVTTHPHPDHIAGLPWVLETWPVGYYVDNGRTAPLDCFGRAEEALAAHPPRHYLNVYRAEAPVLDIDFCPRSDVSAVVLRPRGFGRFRFEDDNSVIVRVDYRESSFLFAGDAGEREEPLLVGDERTAPLLDCDFLKVGWHGHRSASTAGFVKAVSPQVAAISCGEPTKGLNEFHATPRRAAVDRLLPYLRARRDGPGTLTVCDDLKDYDDEDMSFVTQPEDTWIELPVEGAVWATGGRRDLVFLSDGVDVWCRDEVGGEVR